MHLSGLFEGRIHDKSIFDQSGVADLIKKNEKLLMDSGYQGCQNDIPVIIPIKKSKGGELTEE